MNQRTTITEADLNAYVDGELTPERRAVVEAHLADHPVDRERVAAWREQTATLRSLYGHVAEETPPARLTPWRLAAERRRNLSRFAMATAAAMVLVVSGAVGGWVGRGLILPAQSEMTLVSEAEAAHTLYVPEVLHPVEVTGEEGSHLTKWLSKRLDRTLIIPDLSSEGFSLVGGRLLPAARSAAALLMYENRDGARVTLYVVPKDGGETAMRFSSVGDLTAVSWQAEALGCVLVGSLPRETLTKLAKASYGTLDAGSDI
ncbi:anti-sigma factor [Pleomorphomonas diazotrophica]|uniref:Anti-sigma factor n=1 Tax=Pleomorphomonas diazotrophica TaxID=1166257 RepID=A0A1I4WDQ1_9HYPH|nr:anti-sigma factor [Pleomorphomonas diazotrophica]PKR89010.1 anti-sigma factor [Pleomorphomonas diazotrophica]SFN11390.1 Transmembrane transcriptional regulator (anti-sigma factor RsiW) [Pleomorphomonas diazotrophica]